MEVKLSNHAKERSSLRIISKSEVINALNKGTCFNQDDGTIKCIHDIIEVIFRIDFEENTIVVVTMMYTNKFQKQIKKIAKRNRISVRQATRLIKVS